jgi:hypothetical protein
MRHEFHELSRIEKAPKSGFSNMEAHRVMIMLTKSLPKSVLISEIRV